jgi:hypothetical protein
VFQVFACVNHETYGAALQQQQVDLLENATTNCTVHYGQHIQLLHVKSSQKMHVDVRSRAQEDFSMQVGLQKTTIGPGDEYDERLGDDSESFLNAWFCVEPPLQSQQAGDPVRLTDSVLLCNRRWKRYLNARCDDQVQEVSASFHQSHQAARFTIIPFSRPTNHKDMFVPQVIRGGGLVRLFHSESRCFLVNEELNDPARRASANNSTSKLPPHQSQHTNSAAGVQGGTNGSTVLSSQPHDLLEKVKNTSSYSLVDRTYSHSLTLPPTPTLSRPLSHAYSRHPFAGTAASGHILHTSLPTAPSRRSTPSTTTPSPRCGCGRRNG